MGEVEKLDHTLRNKEASQLEYICSIAIHKSQTLYTIRGLLEKYPTFGREKETGLLGALDT